MNDRNACPVCNGHDHTPFAEKAGHRIVRCSGCAFIFQAPLPGHDETTALYDDAYAGTTAGYFGKVDKKMRRSRGRARRLRRLAAGPAPRFLDIGASGGFMVEAARETGFAVQGIELDPKSVAYARQHYPACPIYHGTVEAFVRDTPDATAGFDMIYSAEVIEHVPDVNAFVAAIALLLKPDGRLYLTTPDIGHWRRPRDIQRWDAFDPPSHCLYFDRRSLTRLLTKHGLQIVRRAPAFKPGLKVLVART
jgi:2-polyprenyl-3-methyl-5-hydroxy-6-metoxy-1,4-benzoquinol methylase